MDISITGLHIQTDPKLKEYANQKAKKLIKYDARITDLKVRLFAEKAHRSEDHDYYFQITIHVPGKILEIVDKERDVTKAIDKAVDRMKKALVRHREKTISKRHKEGLAAKLLRRLKHT